VSFIDIYLEGGMRRIKSVVFVWAVLLLPAAAWAALPLITDDTVTQGKGKSLLEVGVIYNEDKSSEDGVAFNENDYAFFSTLTYGITNRIDVSISLIYVWSHMQTEGSNISTGGISDTALGLKWRLFEKDKMSFAVKPVMIIPTGNEEKGLGTGQTRYGAYFIITKEFDPWAIHANLVYIRNENKTDERNDLWQVSLATTYEMVKNLKLCADIGALTNTDKTSEVEPSYLLVGLIYSANENVDISLGVKFGLNEPATDWALLPGVTYRF
jgi:Putative MetA-pathway of phenol degradation